MKNMLYASVLLNTFLLVDAMETRLIKLPKQEQFIQHLRDAGFSEHFMRTTHILDLADKELSGRELCSHVDECVSCYMDLRRQDIPQEHLEFIEKSMHIRRDELKQTWLDSKN